MKETNDMDSVAIPLRRRLNLALFMNAALGRFIFLIGVLSALLLALKMIRPHLAAHSLFLLGLAPIPALLAFIQCKKRGIFFNKYEALEIIDCFFKNDGSVTAFYENPALNKDPDYYPNLQKSLQGRLPVLSIPYYIKRLAPALIFFALSLLIPPRTPGTLEQHRQLVSSLTQPIFDKIEENSILFSDEEIAELTRNLEEIRNDPMGISREKWEAIEEVQERIDKTLDMKNQNIQNMLSDLSKMSSLLDNREQKISAAPGAAQNQARMDKLLSNLDLNNANIRLSSQKQADIEKLLGELKEAADKEAMKNALTELQKCLSSSCQGSEAWYELGKEGDQQGDSEGFGRGGISRGRGDAPMVFGDDKNLPHARFADQEIMNRFLTPEDLIDLGVTPVEPKPDPEKFSPGTLKDFETMRGTEVSRTRISPSQKDVISRYFAK